MNSINGVLFIAQYKLWTHITNTKHHKWKQEFTWNVYRVTSGQDRSASTMKFIPIPSQASHRNVRVKQNCTHSQNLYYEGNSISKLLPIWAAFHYGYTLLPHFLPQKTQNATLFCRGTCIQGRRHLVTAATSVQSCAYRSLWVTIKLNSAAI
jgi:hypothetical protein